MMGQSAAAWLERAKQSHQSGQYAVALREVSESLELDPQQAEAWNLKGVILKQQGRSPDALISYDHALTIDPQFYKAWFNKGILLAELQRYEESIACYQMVMNLKPDLPGLGDRLNEAQHLNLPASRISQSSVIQKGDNSFENEMEETAEAWINRGVEQGIAGNFQKAIASFDLAISLKSDKHEAWSNRGVALSALGRKEESIVSYDKALEIKPDSHITCYNRGLALFDLGKKEEAIASYDKAVEIKPDYHEAWYNQSIALCALGRMEEAMASCDKALAIKQDKHEAWLNRGNVLSALGLKKEAIASYDKAVEIKPDYYQVWYNRGVVLSDLGYKKESITSYDKAVEIKPDYHEAWYNRSLMLSDLEYKEEAIASCDKALAIKPDKYEAWVNRGAAAGSSRQCKTFVSFSLPAAMQNQALDRRGYLGALASYTEGLKYIQKATQPQGWGMFHWLIGKAHYSQSKSQPAPTTFYRQAVRSYHTALETLTPDTYPEDYLKVVQDLVRAELGLGNTAAAQAHQTDGLKVLQTLLNQASTAQKRQLELTFSGFRQLTVDVLVTSGDSILALQEAERYKNRALNWILEDWQEPTWSPTYSDIQRLLTSSRAALYWHLSSDTLTTFLLQANAPEPLVFTQPIQPLQDWLKTWNHDYQDYRDKGKTASPDERKAHPWRQQLQPRLKALKSILGIESLSPHLANSRHLILIPHRDLHRLPLHVLFSAPATYLPSLQVGLTQRDRDYGGTIQPSAALLSIENPRNDLAFAEIESVAIQHLFHNPTVLEADQATLDAVPQALAQPYHLLHFTGHAAYNFQHPEQSAIALANDQLLTAQAISRLNLASYQLICLSACETAITGDQTIETEYVGLVSSFLKAGAQQVVSTFWTVEEASNACIMIRFYEYLLANQDGSSALYQAIRWFRTVPDSDLVQWLQTHQTRLAAIAPLVAEQIGDIIQSAPTTMGLIERQHPYHWAAFTLAGGLPL